MRIPRILGLSLVFALALASCGEEPAEVFAPDVPDMEVTQSPTSWDNPDISFGERDVTDGLQLASSLGQPVPDALIVSLNGLEWVWASPCALNGCTAGIDVGHDGFNFATDAQWAIRPTESAFHGKCASPYFDHTHDHCDQVNLDPGPYPNSWKYGSAPTGGLPTADGLPMLGYSETLLVRVADPQTKDDCKKGGWE
jgi:hypothetical protein